MITFVERIQTERAQRIEQLLGTFDLLGACARACAAAGIEGQEQALAYCLVALSDKADPLRSSKGAPAQRTYRLDPGADDFAEQLAAWASETARNLKRWGPVYTMIQDEADRFEIQTLRRYVRTRHDDVLDCIADTIGVMLAGAPRIDEMTLDAVREEPPGAGAYVFQRPLQWWIATVTRRRRPWDVDPLEEGENDPTGTPVAGALDDVLVDEIVETARQAEDELAELIARVARLRETRALLADALQRAEADDDMLAAIIPASDEDAARLGRVRAALLYEADQLRLEQRAVTSMLAYIVLAMRSAPKLQHVAVLSLRDAAIDREAVDDMAARMRALVDDERHPTPRLVLQAEAARERDLKRSRAIALTKLRKTPARRGAELAPVAQMLDGLPPTVANLAEIVRLTTSTASIVTTYRRDTSKELRAVDTIYDRVFRRYAMGDRA